MIFVRLGVHLALLSSSIGQIAEQHRAYPILHYYHPSRRARAMGPAIAVLDEALMILSDVVIEEHRPAPAELGPAREAISDF